jgi:hypothetical protein
MSSADARPRALTRIVTAIVRRIAAVIRECGDAQRRMAAIRTSPDRYAARPDAAPDTYAEFLFRTSGVLLHEPSARDRAHGRRVFR